MTFANSKYSYNDVLISVGWATVATLDQFQRHEQCLVVDYEANSSIATDKQKLVGRNGKLSGRLECHHNAVSDFDGSALLFDFRGGTQGGTILTSWQPHIVEHEYFAGKSEVRAITMASVLERFATVRELWLNCEGSEIPILLNTPLDLLARCQYISVEFHRFSSFLNITNGDVLTCVQRLEPQFKVVCVEDYHPYYEFFRR